VSLEIAGAQSAGTIEAPVGEALYVLPPGTAAADLAGPLEIAA
jgi:hypothetical protein